MQKRCARVCVCVTVYGYATIIDVSQCGVPVFLPFPGDETTSRQKIVQSIPTCKSILFMTTLQESSLATSSTSEGKLMLPLKRDTASLVKVVAQECFTFKMMSCYSLATCHQDPILKMSEKVYHIVSPRTSFPESSSPAITCPPSCDGSYEKVSHRSTQAPGRLCK